MKFIKILGLSLAIFLLFVSPARAEGGETASDVATELMCQCGCTMILSTCQCATRDEMMTVINQKLDDGQSGEEIVDYFVATYGERVLASPPKKGFNLTAWILPFAAILVGGAVVYLAIRKWLKQGKSWQPVQAASESGEQDDEYRQRLEKDLTSFSERSFR